MQQRRIMITLIILQASLLLSTTSHALTVKGITLPEQVKVGDTTLHLNGAGIRSKFVFDIYVGALYLPSKSHSAKDIINATGASQVSMYFVYDEISQEKMVNGWNEGFENVLSAAEREALKTQIATFNQAFGKTVAGDVIVVAYSPEKGTEVIINKQSKATIPGIEFHQALMKIWFGDDPVDDDLKEGMLGNTSPE